MIYLFNHSKERSLTPAIVGDMCKLATAQQVWFFSPAWGLVPWRVCIGTDPKSLPSRAIAAYLLDDPDVANAGGYHDVDPYGRPYMKAFVRPYLENGGSLLQGPDSVLVALTHEICETRINWDTDDWTQMPDGRFVAKEVCDPVQPLCFSVQNGSSKGDVSNFVLPSWFNENAMSGPFDHMKALAHPFTKVLGGYWIIYDRDTSYTEGSELLPSWKANIKLGSQSRSARRLTIRK